MTHSLFSFSLRHEAVDVLEGLSLGSEWVKYEGMLGNCVGTASFLSIFLDRISPLFCFLHSCLSCLSVTKSLSLKWREHTLEYCEGV